jgi:hypothetical protein
MRSTILLIIVAGALAPSTAACGGEEGPGPRGASGPAGDGDGGVPAGVAAQYATIEEEVKAEGGETNSGPWRVAYIVEPAEGWFERRGDGFEWRAPAEGETHHIEILPIEAESGRLVPEVPVTLEVLDSRGERVARKRLQPYYAEFFHNAENFEIPEPGEYTLRATIEVPDLRRHGEETEEPPLAEGAAVEFERVRLEPEQR